jgi:uncharacterized coiled-coil protein SlyX
MHEMVTELGTAGAIVAATIILLREIRKSTPKPARHDTKRPPSNGRVQALEDKTDAKIERLDTKIAGQTVQLDCLTREQAEVRSTLERQGGKLDTIISMIRRQ